MILFQKREINLKHIESRPSKGNKKDYDFYVDIDEETTTKENIDLVVEDLKVKTKSVVVHREESSIYIFIYLYISHYPA